MKSRPHLRHEISVKRKGREYLGCYYLDGDSITVYFGKEGSGPTPVGKLDPQVCARNLLLQLVIGLESTAPDPDAASKPLKAPSDLTAC